jgi:hypothetical protein
MSEELLSLFYPLYDIERQIQEGQMNPPESQARDGLVLHRENFLRKGKLIDLRLNYRFCAAPLHSHDFIEMAYVLHGRLTHEIEGKTVDMTEGDLLIISIWDFEPSKCDVKFRYTKTQASNLSKRNKIPKNLDIF